jgi:ABC-2 type transport system permease protein
MMVAAQSMPQKHSVLGATLRAIYIIWYRDVIRYWRDRARIVASLAQPLLYLLVFGLGLSSSLSGFGASAGAGGTGLNYVQFMYPGILGMTVLFTSVFSAISIVWDREFGFLKEILVAPINRSAVAIGKGLGGATQALIQGMIMLIFAPLAGVHLSLLIVVELIPVLFIFSFAITSMGVALAAKMKSMQAFQMVMNFLLMPMFFLSGSLFPLGNQPLWMSILTHIDPVSYGIAVVRELALGGQGLPQGVVQKMAGVSFGDTILPMSADLGILSAFGLVMLVLAMRAFRRTE